MWQPRNYTSQISQWGLHHRLMTPSAAVWNRAPHRDPVEAVILKSCSWPATKYRKRTEASPLLWDLNHLWWVTSAWRLSFAETSVEQHCRLRVFLLPFLSPWQWLDLYQSLMTLIIFSRFSLSTFPQQRSCTSNPVLAPAFGRTHPNTELRKQMLIWDWLAHHLPGWECHPDL